MENIHNKNKEMLEFTGHWRKQVLEEIRFKKSKYLATKNKDHWGNCPEEIRWDYMKLTNPVKTIKERIFQMKLMHGRLATGTWLNVMKIENKPACYLCEGKHSRKDTNRHARLYCTNENIQQERRNMSEHIYNAVIAEKGTPLLADIMRKMYGNNERTERATSLKHNKSMPPEWWAAWRKVQSQKTRRHKEDGQAAAAETAVKMGCAYPIWTGVITKSWIWMLYMLSPISAMVERILLNGSNDS